MTFPSPKLVTSIITLGRGDSSWAICYVKSYLVSYTLDGVTWNMADNARVFIGNVDHTNQVKNDLKTRFLATAVRIIPLSAQKHRCMRMDVLFIDP